MDLLQHARELLASAPLVDGHNDMPWAIRETFAGGLDDCDIAAPQPKMQTDIPRLRAGGLGGQFWSVYVPSSLYGQEAVEATVEQIDLATRIVERYDDVFEMAATAADVERIFATGKIASMLGMEGGHSIDSSLATLRAMYGRGVRYMTLTHNDNTPWADSATDEPAAGGLTEFGRQVVGEMNRLGMLVDLSHVSPDTMRAAIAASRAPVIFSHSSTRALCDHPRDVPDDVLTMLASNGGVVMVTFVPSFISQECCDWRKAHTEQAAKGAEQAAAWEREHPKPTATIQQVADHVEHARAVAGADHVGIGGDMDGADMPRGLEDVSCYPHLFAELIGRGWSDEDLRALAGGNVLRALGQAEGVAASLQKLG